MNRKFILVLFYFISTCFGFAQANWIDFEKAYYKIPTSHDGIHRISFTTLSASGIDPNTFDPRNVRVYHRGKEIAVSISGEQDGRFDFGDFIEFFGKRNDGSLDAKLYSDPSFVGNALYNTHNDSTAFFMTITPGIAGKRMATGANPVANLPIPDSYQSEYLRVFSDQYNLSWSYNPGTRLAEFEEGQGWMSTPIVKGTPRNIVLSDLGNIAQSGNAKLEIGITGYSPNPHLTVLSVGQNSGSLREIGRFEFKNFEAIHTEFPFTAADFNSDGSLTLQVASMGPGPADNVGLAYFRITYPKKVTMGDFTQETFILGSGDQVLEVDGVSANYSAFEISNPLDPKVVPLIKEGNKLRFRAAGLPNLPSKIWIENRLNVTDINVMRKVTFRNVLSQPADFIIVTHRSLRRPSAAYPDPVIAYAAHRASAVGGGYDTLVVNIDELYDQFSFGEKTPLAIYEFLRKYYPVHKPEYLFLVGRSMGMFSTAREGNENFFYRKKPSIFSFQDLIPPAGYPYSDNNFSIGLDPENPFVGAIPLGRLPARTPEQVASYLEKVKEKDALGVSEPWQKEIVHLSGGVSAFELTRYFNFLNGFKTIAESPFMGANVTTYRKRSNSTIELIDISGDVNKGISLITFFGHGAPSIIDLEIGFASDPTMGYNNRGKYPMLLLNGCDAGNAFGNAYTFGEDWVLTPSKGATNFLAHANVGVDVYLRRFSESIYTKAFSDSSMIYQSIGLVKKEAEKLFFLRYGNSPINRGHTEQLVMLGDPAVRLFPANKADYSLKDEDVALGSYAGEPFNALADSLKLTSVVRNLGRADMDSVDFRITRRFPEGTIVQFEPKLIGPVLRKDTIEFVVPNRGMAAFGENIFTLEINRSRTVEEMSYANNVITVTRFIPLSGTINLLPAAFGIVSEREVELFSQIPGKSVEERNLIIQMDVVANFSSANRREIRLTTANLVSWKVNLFQNVPEKDSVTFYWRSRFLEPKPEESQDWTVSSFSYIKNGPEGWIQREMPELETNQLVNLEIDPKKWEWKYKDTKLNIEVFTFGTQADSLTFRNTQFFLNEVPYILDNVNNANSRLCPDGSLGLVAFDQKSLTPYLVIPVPGFDILDGRSCGRVPQVIQSIRNANISSPGQRMLIDYVDGLKNGDFVVIFSVGNVNFSDWPDVAFEKLKEVGANEATLRNLKTGDPYVLFGKKGMKPGEAMEIVAKQNIELETNEQVIEFSTEMNGYFTSGSILTPRIGPSSEWKSFFNKVKNRDWFNEEFAHFDVVGVQGNGEEQTLISNIQEDQLDLTQINSELYPYLRLRYSMEDTLSTAPSLLEKWQVNYTGVPEGVLVLKNKEKEKLLREGQEATLNFEFINISKFDFQDSITVEWEFNNTTQRKIEKFSKKIPAIKSGGIHAFSIDFNSIGRGGKIQVEVFANPRIFMEQTFRNNFIDLGAYFVVTPDNSTAILDVNFDGIYIMDGDIVSPSVLIHVLLKNDNTLILKKDTVGMELYLKKDCEACQFERMNFSDPKISWSPATENNSFEVELHPGPLEDGMYTFRVVTADLGVDKPYEINFDVINAATITNFYPYPNPFSTSVRFVFTVTGSEVPDQIKIQIMTVTGRVIREIMQDELGMVRIGNNISEYAWDGKDEFGDQLANGVYIYRVLVRKDGQFMEPRATAGDKAFKQGYGKMYLLR